VTGKAQEMIDTAGIDPQMKQIVTTVMGEDTGRLEPRFARIFNDNPVDLNPLYEMGII
jgi:hypothetical protein